MYLRKCTLEMRKLSLLRSSDLAWHVACIKDKIEYIREDLQPGKADLENLSEEVYTLSYWQMTHFYIINLGDITFNIRLDHVELPFCRLKIITQQPFQISNLTVWMPVKTKCDTGLPKHQNLVTLTWFCSLHLRHVMSLLKKKYK